MIGFGELLFKKSGFVFNNWYPDTTFKANLGSDYGYYSAPHVFYMGTTLYLILARQTYSSSGGSLSGLVWNGTQWTTDANIISGLTPDAQQPNINVIKYGTTYYAVMGGYAGTVSFYEWTGSAWTSSTYFKSNWSYSVTRSSVPVCFIVGSNIYMILLDSSGTTFRGYIFNGSTWSVSSTPYSGLSTTDSYPKANVFIFEGELHYVVENATYLTFYKWGGSSWSSAQNLVAGLTLLSYGSWYNSIFKYNNTYYMLGGELNGRIISNIAQE